MYPEVGVEQDLTRFEKCFQSGGDNNCADEEGRAVCVKVLTDKSTVGSIRSAIQCR